MAHKKDGTLVKMQPSDPNLSRNIANLLFAQNIKLKWVKYFDLM